MTQGRYRSRIYSVFSLHPHYSYHLVFAWIHFAHFSHMPLPSCQVRLPKAQRLLLSYYYRNLSLGNLLSFRWSVCGILVGGSVGHLILEGSSLRDPSCYMLMVGYSVSPLPRRARFSTSLRLEVAIFSSRSSEVVKTPTS